MCGTSSAAYGLLSGRFKLFLGCDLGRFVSTVPHWKCRKLCINGGDIIHALTVRHQARQSLVAKMGPGEVDEQAALHRSAAVAQCGRVVAEMGQRTAAKPHRI
jgi:hypothetical protein